MDTIWICQSSPTNRVFRISQEVGVEPKMSTSLWEDEEQKNTDQIAPHLPSKTTQPVAHPRGKKIIKHHHIFIK